MLQQRLALPLALDDEDACAQGQHHLRRVTVDVRAVLLEHALLALQIFQVTAEPVADVTVLGEDAQRFLLTASADQDLRAARLDRPR